MQCKKLPQIFEIPAAKASCIASNRYLCLYANNFPIDKVVVYDTIAIGKTSPKFQLKINLKIMLKEGIKTVS